MGTIGRHNRRVASMAVVLTAVTLMSLGLVLAARGLTAPPEAGQAAQEEIVHVS